MKRLFYTSFFLTLTTVYGLLCAHDILPSYNMFPADKNTMEKVYIIYNKDFPYKQNYNEQHIKGCKKTYIKSTFSNKKDEKKTVAVLRCVEHIKLLRSDKIVNQWVRIQNKKHFFLLTLNTFNFVNIHAQITAIRPVKSDDHQSSLYNKQTKKVTGQFERHTANVKKYTFRNMKTGKTTTVNATSEHPVYVKNRAAFIPMNLLRVTDQLLNSAGQEIRLICPGNRMQRCGELLHNHIPLPVYSLEIDHHHTYFVSSIRLLVHNTCELARKLLEKIPDLIRSKVFSEKEESFLYLQSREDVQRAFTVLRELEGNNVESDSHVILSICRYFCKKIRIKQLESFLQKRKNLTEREYDDFFYRLIQTKTMEPKPFIYLNVETETVFSDLLLEATRNWVVVVTDRKRSLIFPSIHGDPVLEILQKSELKIERYCLDMGIDTIIELASTHGYGQPLKYCILMES